MYKYTFSIHINELGAIVFYDKTHPELKVFLELQKMKIYETYISF